MSAKSSLARMGAALVMALAVATPAHAGQILTFGFTGTVTTVDKNRGLFGPIGEVNVGDSFSGQFSYETGPGNPDQLPGDMTVGRYILTDFFVNGSVAPLGDMTILVRLMEPGSAIPPNPAPPGSDQFNLFVESANYSRGINLFLWAPYQSLFTDDGLPTSLDLSAFTERAVLAGLESVLQGEPNNDIGDIESLFLIRVVEVPEPGMLALFGIGLAGLGLVRRRRLL